jgi:hypothetical protein
MSGVARRLTSLSRTRSSLESVGLIITKSRRKPAFADFKKLHASRLP